ncbi:MAG TPA: secretin N-terminal domain-containing protein [Verrucomicrobiae bacterium]|jgi:type II secretory pathway component GspD/PulD (secretin)
MNLPKITRLFALSLLASGLAAQAQTNSAPTNPPANAVFWQLLTNSTATTHPVATAITNPPPKMVVTNPIVAVTNPTVVVTTSVIKTNRMIMPLATAPAVTNPPAVTPAVTTNEPAIADTKATDATNEPVSPEISLIQFSDVPLTTAIENLARRAGINYMLDPKIGYGQTDQAGQAKAEPILSIRWENITPESALMALLDNYGLQLVHSQNTSIARVTLKDPTALPALTTRVMQLKYASVSNMVEAVQSTLSDKRSKVIADNRTSQLVVVATDPEQQAVTILIDRLDTPTRQVLIETKLVEISSTPTSSKGVDWTGTLQAQHVRFGNDVSQAGRYSQVYDPATGVTTYGPPLPIANPAIMWDTAKGLNPTTAFLDADGVSAVLSFLNSSSDAQVVSTPRVVTLDNEQAQISVFRGYPVFSVSASTANTTGGSSVSYTNVGTLLKVTPRISANDKIWLDVNPEVSTYGGIQSQTVGGLTYQADLFDFRTFNTRVLVPNAHTLVMGGLVQDNPQSTTTKVPLLGDIPFLGYAFRSESKTATKDNLLIFITPTIVKDDDFHSTDSQFLKAQPIKRPEMVNPNSLWDGTKPYNWSNPTNTDPAQAIINEPVVQ